MNPRGGVARAVLTAALVLVGRVPWARADARELEALERRLATEVTLGDVLALAAARSPEATELAARRDAALARADGVGLRPAPELFYEQWGVPLAEPWNLMQANMLMLGARQMFPAPGLRDVLRRAAERDADGLGAVAAARRLAVAAEVRRALVDCVRADASLALERDTRELAAGMVEATRARFAAGQLSAGDLLRASTELARLGLRLARAEQDVASARARLNVRLGRAPEAPLGRLQPPPRPTTTALPEGTRPELDAAQAAVGRAQEQAAATRLAADRPSIMVGLEYQAMPMQAHVNSYGAMVGMTLPWLDPAREARVREAVAATEADRAALETVRRGLALELAEATYALAAARRELDVLDRDVLPGAEASFAAAQASFAGGRESALGVLDGLRSLAALRLERVGALARLDLALIDLDRAVGHASPVEEGR